MIEDGEDIEITCDFCKKQYSFTVEDIKDIKLSK
jgi:redox-regulated HSP33 family molecular chaperone